MGQDVTLPVGTKLPLICTYRDAVGGNGFLAQIELRGRLLYSVEEDAEVWFYGIQPCGLAESGSNFSEAHNAFRQAYTASLYDLAAEAKSYVDFKQAVENFGEQHAEALTTSWCEAAKNITPEIAEKLGLTIEPAQAMPYVKIKEVPNATPEINKFDDRPALAAKAA